MIPLGIYVLYFLFLHQNLLTRISMHNYNIQFLLVEINECFFIKKNKFTPIDTPCHRLWEEVYIKNMGGVTFVFNNKKRMLESYFAALSL